MSTFSFARDAGDKVIEPNTESLLEHVDQVGLGRPAITATIQGSTVTVTGEASSQEEKEKIVLALGNIDGIAAVDDQITISGPVSAASRFVMVKLGETLSSIAQAVYGNANLYNKILEANKPMLTDPNRIYPGQVLRVPE